MSAIVEVSIQMEDGKLEKCLLTISDSEPWKISLQGAGYDEYAVEAKDLFDGLILLRNELEKSGKKILCNGARKNVWPSGMSRSMGGGRKAYLMEIGCRARELVNIFDYAPPELIVSTKEQEEFSTHWFSSPKS
jgi:hypothetical protein